MKKLCIILFFLVSLFIDNNLITKRYYVSVIFQNQSMYDEYMTSYCLYKLIGDFVDNPDIESIYITRDLLCVIDQF